MRKYYKNCNLGITLRIIGKSVVVYPFSLAEVLLDGVFPVFIQRRIAPDSGHGLAHHLVVEAGTLAVAVVVHRPVGGKCPDGLPSPQRRCWPPGRETPSRTFPSDAGSFPSPAGLNSGGWRSPCRRW